MLGVSSPANYTWGSERQATERIPESSVECLICACPLEGQIRELGVGQGMWEPEACIIGSIGGWGGKDGYVGNPNFVEMGFTIPEQLTRHLSLAALVPGAKNTAVGDRICLPSGGDKTDKGLAASMSQGDDRW